MLMIKLTSKYTVLIKPSRARVFQNWNDYLN